MGLVNMGSTACTNPLKKFRVERGMKFHNIYPPIDLTLIPTYLSHTPKGSRNRPTAMVFLKRDFILPVNN